MKRRCKMSNKFTEQEYKKIIEGFDKINANYRFGLLNENVAREFRKLMNNDYDVDFGWSLIVALANPLTREWAHDKFVEKEKKYYWTTKKLDKYGVRGRLYKTTDDTIKPYFDDILNDTDEQLTESEVREWGYNPDMFDKDEVK